MIDYFQLSNPLTRLKSKVAYKARVKIYNHFIKMIKPGENCTILDMGVTPDTTLPETNFLEKVYPYTRNITMASIEDASNLEQIFKGTRFVQLDGSGTFPFKNNEFDILFCSAVLEHVGDYDMQRLFIEECARVAKEVYLTTPNKRFPIEFHTYLPCIHWLPRKAHQKILRLFGMHFWAETKNLNLLTRRKLRSLLSSDIQTDSKIYFNRLFGFVTNLILFVEKK
jgi:ubiquinone/menaquinone biosynthesis C-methylase UbiE